MRTDKHEGFHFCFHAWYYLTNQEQAHLSLETTELDIALQSHAMNREHLDLSREVKTSLLKIEICVLTNIGKS